MDPWPIRQSVAEQVWAANVFLCFPRGGRSETADGPRCGVQPAEVPAMRSAHDLGPARSGSGAWLRVPHLRMPRLRRYLHREDRFVWRPGDAQAAGCHQQKSRQRNSIVCPLIAPVPAGTTCCGAAFPTHGRARPSSSQGGAQNHYFSAPQGLLCRPLRNPRRRHGRIF